MALDKKVLLPDFIKEIVDIFDWALIPESFKNEIIKHHEVLNAGMDRRG